MIADYDTLKSWIDIEYDAKEIMELAKSVDKNLNSSDLSMAYEILIDEYDEHDDIDSFKILHDYIDFKLKNN